MDCHVTICHNHKKKNAISGSTQIHTTSVTLLERLRQPGQEEAWIRFVRLYTPLVYYWARRVGMQSDEAADLVQEVLVTLIQKMPEFTYDPHQSFRGWLRTVTVNKWRERSRRMALNCQSAIHLSEIADEPSIPAFEETEYRQQLVQRALQVMQRDFEPTTWKACWEFVVSGRSVQEIAKELGVSIAVVYGAKSRVLHRLRQELQGLLD